MSLSSPRPFPFIYTEYPSTTLSCLLSPVSSLLSPSSKLPDSTVDTQRSAPPTIL